MRMAPRQTYDKLAERFGHGMVLTGLALALIGVALALSTFGFISLGAPTTFTITAGPEGSAFERYAERYQKILAREGVTLKILPSKGSRENLQRLAEAKGKGAKAGPDVGFVLGGEAGDEVPPQLVSLGSVAVQPMMVFYRGKPRALLSDFKGLRLDIGPEGSGTHTLALAMLKANGIEPGTPGDTTRFVDTANEVTAAALITGRIDAFFATSESTPAALTRGLMRAEGVHLFHFAQADGYTRKIKTLNKLMLPRGAIDLGEDIPAQDTQLVGPTVELIARDSLHPALVDLLLDAAREVHGQAGLYRKRGDYPAPLEHEFRISPDASRYYAQGKSFLYRTFPFWLASLITRLLAVLVPIVLLMVPALRVLPTLYRWRMTSRIYRWYGALQRLEREARKPDATPTQRDAWMQELDRIEQAVRKIEVPAAFGDLFYGLRGHIAAVRQSLLGVLKTP